MITELNERSREIFRYIVDTYLETGTPVGSGTIAKELGLNLSPASIRNVMASLETSGLLYSPHTSAGRMPTQSGLQLYIEGLMEVGDLTKEERAQIDSECSAGGRSLNDMLDKASHLLSGLSTGAGLVTAPKIDKPLQQIQFVKLEPRRILCIMVMKGGLVENRIMDLEHDINESALQAAANYLNHCLADKTLSQARQAILQDIEQQQAQLDDLTRDLVLKGIAIDPSGPAKSHIIIRGQSRLLNDLTAMEDLERVRLLFEALEAQEMIENLLQSAQNAEGVQIFIGSENKMFEHSGWSMVISPYKGSGNNIVGAIGVIGPTRLNYGRIIPLVDYTSKVMSRLMGDL